MKEKIVMEFSERWLKAAVIETTGAGPGKIQKMFLEPVEPDSPGFSPAITKIFAQAGKKKFAETTVVIGRNKATVRRIDLPSRDPAEIEKMLGLHVIHHVPYPREQIVWGSHNLGFDGISNSHILLAIAHRDSLRNVFNSFVSLSIQVENIFLSSPGIVHYVRESARDKTPFQQCCLILDIDNASSELMVVNKLQLNSSVMISQGAEQLRSEGGPAKFLAELKQALSAFRDDLAANTGPATVFLTGGAPDAGGISGFIEKDLGLKIQVLPVPGCPGSPDVSFASLLGFTGSRKKDDVEFTLPEILVKKEMKQKIRQLLVLGVLLVYLFIMLGSIAVSYVNQRQAYLDKVTLAVKLLQSRNEGLTDIARTVELSKPYVDPGIIALNALYQLFPLVPDNIVITQFNWDKKKGLSIRGYALEIPDIFSFVNALDGSSMFKGMKTRSTRRQKVKDKEVVYFDIGAQ